MLTSEHLPEAQGVPQRSPIGTSVFDSSCCIQVSSLLGLSYVEPIQLRPNCELTFRDIAGPLYFTSDDSVISERAHE